MNSPESSRPGRSNKSDSLEITNSDVQAMDATATAIETALIGGDLSKLTVEQRLSYYNRVCQTLGLNPLTRPLEYLNLQGKTVLYARKDCTEQLRKINGVSVDSLQHDYRPELGVYVVTATGHDKHGRNDSSTGAVPIGPSVKGEMLANLVMKAETKAKRRLTLSICGLGMLDETEVESIPGALPLGSCNDCGDEQCGPGKVVCEKCEAKRASKVPQFTEGEPEKKKISLTEEKKQAITDSKEVNEFVSLLAEHFPDAALRQQVGFAVTGTRTVKELKAYPVAKLAGCTRVLREVVKRVKQDRITAPDDIVTVVHIVQEDYAPLTAESGQFIKEKA